MSITRTPYMDYEVRETAPELKIELHVNTNLNHAMCFRGRQKNASWHYRYKSAERMEDQLAKFIEEETMMYNVRQDAENKMKAEKIKIAAAIKVGDIFNYSWGWEQTNQQFFEVIEKKTPMTMVVREIACETIKELSWASSQVRPARGHFLENKDEKSVRLDKWGGFKCNHGRASKVENPDDSSFYSSSYA